MPPSRRWSDEELDKFRADFDEHRIQLNAGMDENHALFIDNQKEIAEIKANTSEILELWRDLGVLGKFAHGIGSLGKWIASLTIFVILYDWYTK